MRETGFLQVDVEYDFLRARRHQVLAALAHRLRRWRGDGNRLVPLDEVADPASWRGERQLGRQTIRLDTIIGAAEPRRDFDRRFRPTSTGCGSGGSGWRWPSGAVNRSRRSRSTASAAAIS